MSCCSERIWFEEENIMSLYLLLKSLLEREDGQDLIEYSLIIALIVLVAVVTMGAVGTSIQGIWTNIAGQLGASGS
jgi:Flp pilus assembly pilin Flp